MGRKRKPKPARVPARFDTLDLDRDGPEWSQNVNRLAVWAVEKWGPLPGMDAEESRAEFVADAVRLVRRGTYDPAKGRLSTYLANCWFNSFDRWRRHVGAQKRTTPGDSKLVLFSAIEIESAASWFGDGHLRGPADMVADHREKRPDVAAADRERAAFVAGLLRHLDPRGRQVVGLAHGLDGDGPFTLTEISRRLGVTRERVRQLYERAVARLRRFAPPVEPDF